MTDAERLARLLGPLCVRALLARLEDGRGDDVQVELRRRPGRSVPVVRTYRVLPPWEEDKTA